MSQDPGFFPIAEEKPDHYRYLKNFRTHPCELFFQHRCDKAKPYSCFDYHYLNQRRRPSRRDTKDGTFNYSPTDYCPSYDSEKGTCRNGDKCPLLHKTLGDTEKLYHLRNYKTSRCHYPVDAKGQCIKNGAHCPYAHTDSDVRQPVCSASEMKDKKGSFAPNHTAPSCTAVSPTGSQLAASSSSLSAAAARDLDWKSSSAVMEHFKTEMCSAPSWSCQGPCCPKYHNVKDRRRSPYKYSYRPQPCHEVKVDDIWEDPTSCPRGDKCMLSHTRNEQQFHPEVYKSRICNDYMQRRPCPRRCFCAFAHGEQEKLSVDRSMKRMGEKAASYKESAPEAKNEPALSPHGAAKHVQFGTSATAAPAPAAIHASIGAATSTAGASAPVLNASAAAKVSGPGAVATASGTSWAVAVTGAVASSGGSEGVVSSVAATVAAYIPAAAMTTSSTGVAGLASINVTETMVSVEELYHLIDSDPSIDILEKKRRKKLVCDVAGSSNSLTFDLYSNLMSDDSMALSDGYKAEDILTPLSLHSLVQFNGLKLTDNAATSTTETLVVQMLLDAKRIVSTEKLEAMSLRELRTISKQLRKELEIVDQVIDDKISS